MTIIREPHDHAAAQQYVQDELLSTLQPALASLARARPADPVTWLAEYLLAHKPARRPSVADQSTFPMYGMLVNDFLALDKLLPHNELVAQGLVKIIPESEETAVNFVSHQVRCLQPRTQVLIASASLLTSEFHLAPSSGSASLKLTQTVTIYA